MATITDIKPDFLSLTENKKLELILNVRERRRIFKKPKTKAVAARREKKSDFHKILGSLTAEEKVLLLEKYGGKNDR